MTTPNILQRIQTVRAQITYLKKEKRVEGYMAVTHDQVTEYLREHLIEAGVLVVPNLVPGTTKVVPTGTFTSKGTPFIRFEAEYDVHFVNVDDKTDREVVRLPAHAIDHGDKAPGKATSYATKAAELKMFNIVTGEDDEERPVDEKGGMPETVIADWRAKIDEIKTAAEGQNVWGLIKTACEQANDRPAATKLMAHLTAKLAALKKAALKKAAAKAAPKPEVKEPAHA